jgi:type III pantothenate kinase
MTAPLLTLDLGNSGLKACLWSAGPAPDVLASARFALDAQLPARLIDWLRAQRPGSVPRAALSSVAPAELEAAVSAALRRELGASFAGTPRPGVENATQSPAGVGADRLFAARGAYERTRRSTIVVDAGTAVTVDALEAAPRPRFLGGAIAPGPGLLASSLSAGTARLPRVEPRAGAPALGRDTEAALQAGIVHGFRGAVRELVRGLAGDLGWERAPIVLTGGSRALLVEPPLFERAECLVDEHLVHRGLAAALLDAPLDARSSPPAVPPARP